VLPDQSKPDMTYFLDRRDALLAAMAAIGRDPSGFALAAQVPAGRTAEHRRAALAGALEARRCGATHVIIGIPPSAGPAAVDDAARDIAVPLRDAG
jgi:type II secretory pathway predicted ATPase ExeA